MSFLLADRVQETTSTTGTGTLTLTGAVSQFRTFVSGIGVGNPTYYALLDGNGVGWEIGSGTVGSGTLTRTTILASSNGGSAIVLSAFSPHYVYSDAPAAAIQLIASIADSTILANISGAAAAPAANSLSSIVDHTISSTQGVILYRGASTWSALPTGTSGQVLQTLGASANPQWHDAVLSFNTRIGAVTLTSGDVTTALGFTPANIASPTFTGTPAAPTPLTADNSTNIATTAFVKAQGYLTGNQSVTLTGAVTGSGTTSISTTLATVSNQTILANISGSTNPPSANTLTAIIDTISSTQGVILYRDTTSWLALATGTASGQGQFLATGGASANPAWTTIGYTNLPSELQKSLAQASIPGLMPISTKVMIIPIVMSMQIPANFAGSNGYSIANATSSYAFTVSYLHLGSPSTIGTFTFSSAGSTPALSTQAAVNLVAGDVVLITTALASDASLADVGLTLVLLKQ